MEKKTTVISPEALQRQEGFCGRVREYWQAQGITPVAFVETYGCQQNEADSEQIRGMLEHCGYGLTDGPEGADLVIFNTCAIREHAEQRVFGNVGALVHTRRRHPRQKIFLCGCMMGQPAVVERVRKSYPYVDGVFSTHHLWELPQLLLGVLTTGKRVFSVEDSAGAIAEGLPVVRENKLKAWVSVMYGCNNFCSYCIVPYVRGRERSRQPEDILQECRALIAQGYKEITLLGQNVNSYGKDLGLGVDFADLMAQIASLPGDFRLRFMTSHPKDASHKLFDTIAAYPKICKQFHLPFQSGNDRVLHAMNRRYTVEQYLNIVDYLRERRPDFSLTSDLIVGFPNESEADFQGTLDLIQRVQYDNLYTFIYSKRSGTKAANMPDATSDAEKRQRMERLLTLQREIATKNYKRFLGRTMRVLVEGDSKRGDGWLFGKSNEAIIVEFMGDRSLIGTFLRNIGDRWCMVVVSSCREMLG